MFLSPDPFQQGNRGRGATRTWLRHAALAVVFVALFASWASSSLAFLGVALVAMLVAVIL
jgi:hypothetical protein